MKVGYRLGGHWVQGHVDAVARVLQTVERQGAWDMRIELPSALAAFFVHKGSATLNGVSLTVNALRSSDFSVSLIPETVAQTNLKQLRPGDVLNLEADALGKHVARLYAVRGG